MEIFRRLKEHRLRRHKLKEVKKQMNMTRRCCNELDGMFTALGLDMAEVEVQDIRNGRTAGKNI